MPTTLPTRVLQTRLSTNFTVEDYIRFREAKDSIALATLLHARINERYWLPLSSGSQSGFVQLVISCLLIEFFWSMKHGKKKSEHGSKQAFIDFFHSSPRFSDLQPVAGAFYTNVRCGLIHQAEITGGWRVSRKSTQTSLYDKRHNIIQAQRFQNALKAEIRDFIEGLKKLPTSHNQWKLVIKKFNHIVESCL